MELPIPLGVWGRVVGPPGSVGCFVLIERESPEGWKVTPPEDAYRVWSRRPGVPDDHDDNWTFWFRAKDVDRYFGPGGLEIAEWLPEGAEPKWAE